VSKQTLTESSSFKTCVYRSNYALSQLAHDPLVRDSKKWRSRTHSACEKSVRFPIPINTDHLFVVTLLISKSKCEPPRYSRITAAFCYLHSRYTHTSRAGSSLYANYLSFRWDLSATRNILSSELLETTRIDVDYQVRITDARILTNIQVIDLQASLTARFEYIESWIWLSNKGSNHYNKESHYYYRLSVRAFQTRWHQRYKHTIAPIS